MTRPVGGQHLTYPRRVPDRPEDHPQLMAWYAEQDALNAPIPSYCQCFVDDERGGCEYEPESCPLHAGTLGQVAE